MSEDLILLHIETFFRGEGCMQYQGCYSPKNHCNSRQVISFVACISCPPKMSLTYAS